MAWSFHRGTLQRVGAAIAVAALLVVLAATVLPALAQGISGRPGFDLPGRTDAGEWAGTWYYVNRDSQIALWLRDTKKGPELRIRYMNTGRAEGFQTDWNGQAEYHHHGKIGNFHLDITQRDAKTIKGKWTWTLGLNDKARSETARVTMYRAGDGRALVMNFDDLERFLSGNAAAHMTYSQVWTFRKVSRNERRWEELPF